MKKATFYATCLTMFSLVLLWQGNVLAQQVTGVVTDESNDETLPGVNIIVKGTMTGTTTDVNGQYELNAPSLNDTLIFSYIGFQTVEVPIDGRQEIDVQLSPVSLMGEDIVVVGYGTQQRRELTGSISSIDGDDMKSYSTSDPADLIQGRVPGVQVNSDGQPGAAPNIRIRGVGTFGNNSPLFVIDGVPVGTSIRDFNPNDITSIEILKDASAAAIYGSRAANGVVLITTQQGTTDTPLQVEYSGYFGIDEVWQRMPVTGREDYQMLVNEGLRNAGMPLVAGNDPNSPLYIDDINTDWQEEGLKTGQRMNHNLTFYGGGENTTYNLSLDYLDSEGTLVGHGPDYERYSTRLNTTAEKGIFKFGQSFYYTYTNEKALNYNTSELTGGRPPMIVDLVSAIPTLGLYDPSVEGGCAGTDQTIHRAIVLNVPCTNQLLEGETNVSRTFASAYGEVDIIDDNQQTLTYKISGSYDRTNVRNVNWVPEFVQGFFFSNAAADLNDGENTYYTGVVENTLTYDREFEGNHDVTLLVGHTYQRGGGIFRNGYAEGFPKPYFKVLDNGNTKTSSGSENANALESYFTRLNYNYDDRYLLTATLRRDGSSRFPEDNRYGNFPSASVGWNLHNEDFFSLPSFINQLKVRASYGQLGNQSIGEYQYIGTINTSIPYNWNGSKVFGATQTQVVNTEIQWETKTTANIGIDARFLKNMFDLTAEYYSSTTSDILVAVPIPNTTGAFDPPTVNAGELRNSGLELALSYNKMQGDFTFDISANFSTLKNEVLALGGNDEPIYGVGTKTEVGGEIGRHFGHKVEGIFQSQEEIDNHAFQNNGTAPGDLKFKDVNEDGVINADDRTYLGSGLPKYTYGLNFTGQYKQFDFTVFASGMGGHKINSRIYRYLMLTSDYLNYHEDMLDRWTPENRDTNIPRRVVNDPNNNGRDSDREGWLQNGTFLRINTVAVGYSLPQSVREMVGVKNTRVYFQVQNLYSFQHYKGYNPDFTAGTFEPGYDNGSYPKPRSFMVGLEIGF
ncbi:SusC/RagA family TonB-linked outer membrane protein [Gracilimonas mengyeensis]|uniref:TonB-linked outer membrane protein, SusC/RagA family n=1 Tax=Gracilimonas mengyeensis TaxID=1302730 RepID=A0A521AY74_9BACT|nr:TonB-dependent receptor [Gracilimonas mengyeensis]SMO39793.1 TonB-linked outer membrane protein, SusC/RagA family [Gracilimonas mengyeensis]